MKGSVAVNVDSGTKRELTYATCKGTCKTHIKTSGSTQQLVSTFTRQAAFKNLLYELQSSFWHHAISMMEVDVLFYNIVIIEIIIIAVIMGQTQF